jgi:hypothetical protein
MNQKIKNKLPYAGIGGLYLVGVGNVFLLNIVTSPLEKAIVFGTSTIIIGLAAICTAAAIIFR